MNRLLHLAIGTAVALGAVTGAHDPVHGFDHRTLPTSGTIRFDRAMDGHAGNATLQYDGKPHRLSIRVTGMSTADVGERFATGHAYHLSHLSHLSGGYGSLRHNISRVTHKDGALWLENGNGVVIALQSRQRHAAPIHVRSVRVAFTH